MEPLSTAIMISGIVAFLSSKLSKDKSINNFFSDFTEATVSWLRPIFLTEEGEEKEIIHNLKQNPESVARRKAVESALEIGVEDNPGAKSYIQEVFDKISQTEQGYRLVNQIINSKNVNTGNIDTKGGDVHIGDSK